MTSSSTASSSMLPIVSFASLRFDHELEDRFSVTHHQNVTSHPMTQVATLQDNATTCLDTLLNDEPPADFVDTMDFDLDKMFDDAMIASYDESAAVSVTAVAAATLSPPSNARRVSVTQPATTIAATSAFPLMITSFSPASDPRSILPLPAPPVMASTLVAIAPRDAHNVSPSPSEDTISTDNPKKRKRTAIRTSTNKKPAFSIDALPIPSLASPEEEEDIRKERNRLHAKASRQRKKELQQDLEQSLQLLQDENTKLRAYLAKNMAVSVEETASKELNKPTEHFLQQLKSNPNNRVVNAKTLRFLKGLRKNVHFAKTLALDVPKNEEATPVQTTTNNTNNNIHPAAPTNNHTFRINYQKELDFLGDLEPFQVIA